MTMTLCDSLNKALTVAKSFAFYPDSLYGNTTHLTVCKDPTLAYMIFFSLQGAHLTGMSNRKFARNKFESRRSCPAYVTADKIICNL